MMIFTAGRMIPAIMSLFMRVMAALYVWIILQFPIKQRFYRSTRITRYSAIKFNTDLGESCPRAASDATTDQYIRFQSRKYSCECAMPALRGSLAVSTSKNRRISAIFPRHPDIVLDDVFY